MRRSGLMFLACTTLAGATLACTDSAARPFAPAPPDPSTNAVKFWDVTASTRWNRRALDLLSTRPPANAQAWVVRMLAYLSIAQHRAVLAAERGKDGKVHPSVSAAVGGASVVVLSHFFPLDIALHESRLDADLAAPEWPGARHEDEPSGEAIGRAVGAAVIAWAITDNYLQLAVPPALVGPQYWFSNGTATVRAMWGTRPILLSSPSELRPPPPPAIGSAEFLAALAEVRAISDTRTQEQADIAVLWASGSAPFTAGVMNLVVDEVIEESHRTEKEAARILAYANAAAFDSQIACWDAKFHYWYPRPIHMDPLITLAIGMPNHPSYPSGHSCLTSAIMTVAALEIPGARPRLEEAIRLAGLSRIYGGIHFRFDIDAGQDIGTAAARLALSRSLE
jgi:membrane-associated phospholipid phosphatase